MADPRARRGVRHGVVSVLVIAACATLAGSRSYAAIAQWAAALGAAVLQRLGVPGAVPCEATLRRCLQAVDADELDGALSAWLLARVDALPVPRDVNGMDVPLAEQRRVISLDGKRLRGCAPRAEPGQRAAAARGGGRVHLVAARDLATGVIAGQVACDRVKGKGGEPAAARTLLARCQRLPWGQVSTGARIRSCGHGRVETRTIKILSLDPRPDGRGPFFPGAAQAIKVIRTRARLHVPATRETMYAITSLAHHQAHPALLAAWLQGHWGIENSVHWVRDVTFDEDRSQVRTGAGPRNLAPLRNLAISALRLSGAINIAAGLREHALHPLLPLTTYGLT